MRLLSIAILLMAVFAFSPVKSAEADISFSVGFHDELSPYGTWMNYSGYGNVWRPYNYTNFHPYSDGYWNYSDYGPTWYGNEPYASYVYHYGNWMYVPRLGWVWVPGNEWHPGRVNWSYGGGYIGWRPQFPSWYNYGGYGSGYGGFGNDYNFWVVIDSDRFGYRNYSPYRLGRDRVRDLFARRVFRQRYDTFRRADLERIVRRPIRVVNLREREVRIGDRRARIRVTPDEEVRIRRHVTQVRGRRGDDGRRVVERDTVMKRKFDDIRTKSSNVRRADEDRRRTEVRRNEVQRNEVRRSEPRRNEVRRVEPKRNEIRKPDSRSKQKVEKNTRSTKKEISTRDSSRSRRDSDRVSKASSSRRGPAKVERTSSRRPAPKVERASRTVRKSEVKSTRSGRGKAEVSKVKRSTKKESSRKPTRRKN